MRRSSLGILVLVTLLKVPVPTRAGDQRPRTLQASLNLPSLIAVPALDQQLKGLNKDGFAVIPVEILISQQEAGAIPNELAALKPDYERPGFRTANLTHEPEDDDNPNKK